MSCRQSAVPLPFCRGQCRADAIKFALNNAHLTIGAGFGPRPSLGRPWIIGKVGRCFLGSSPRFGRWRPSCWGVRGSSSGRRFSLSVRGPIGRRKPARPNECIVGIRGTFNAIGSRRRLTRAKRAEGPRNAHDRLDYGDCNRRHCPNRACRPSSSGSFVIPLPRRVYAAWAASSAR